MKYLNRLLAVASAAFFIAGSALAQTSGTVSNHAFAIGKGAGTTGYTSLLCGASQIPLGQAGADPVCQSITGVDFNKLNAKTANYTIASTDCGGTIQAGTGSTGYFTITLPAVAGFPSDCPVNIKNGDTTRAKGLSGFPSDIVSPKLYPLQFVSVKIVNGVWATAVNPGRWKIPNNTTVYMDAINGNDANDCLAAGTGNACQTFGQVLRINLKDYYDLTGTSNFSSGNLGGTALLNVQLADNQTSAGACTTCYAGAHLAFNAMGFEGRAAIVIRGNVATPGNTIIADAVANAGIAVYGGGLYVELDSVQIGQSSCAASPKNINDLSANDHGMIRFERGVIVGCASSSQFAAGSGGFINADNGFSIAGGAAFGGLVQDNASIQFTNQVITCIGSPAYSNSTFTAVRNGSVNLQGVTWASCGTATGTKFSASSSGYIFTGTSCTLTSCSIPGNANGNIASNGVIDDLIALGANVVTRANEAQGVARSVIGVAGNATANVADIQGAAGQILAVNPAGTSLAFVGPGQTPGTATNDNAAAGTVGELISVQAPYDAVGATITVTIASPAVVTWTAHGLVNTTLDGNIGVPVFFTTTGALPTGIVANTTYFAVPTGVNTFQIATTPANALAGTYINTSGSQSGVQTALKGLRIGTTSTAVDVAGITLTAGDWDVGGLIQIQPIASATITLVESYISTTTLTRAASPAGGTYFFDQQSKTAGTGMSTYIGKRRLSLSATTTVYFGAFTQFTGTALNITAYLGARRIR